MHARACLRVEPLQRERGSGRGGTRTGNGGLVGGEACGGE